MDRKKQCNGELLYQFLLEYIYRKRSYYENEIIEFENHVVYRKADPVDHFEMIMAQTRLATMEKVSTDLYRLIELSREK